MIAASTHSTHSTHPRHARHAPASASGAPAPNRKGYYFYGASVLIALAASAVLVAVIANAQAAEPTASARTAIEPAAPPPAVVAAATPRYSAKDIGRAFAFMDADHDGLVSRQEAASFRNVAKHFDAADTNKDNMLSPAELSSALNRP